MASALTAQFALREVWLDALRTLALPASQPALVKALEQWHWAEAVTAAAKAAPKSTSRPKDTILSDESVPSPAPVVETSAPAFTGAAAEAFLAAAAAHEGGATALHPLPTQAQLTRRLSGIQDQLSTLAGWVTVVVVVIFVGGVYALFHEAWTGTWKEIMGIFLAAFSADLSTQGLVTLAQSSPFKIAATAPPAAAPPESEG